MPRNAAARLGSDPRYQLTPLGYSIPLKVALTAPLIVVRPKPARKKTLRGGVLAAWGTATRHHAFTGKQNKGQSVTLEGITIVCAGCGKDFDSFGLRCCSPQCESRLTNKFQIVVSDNDTRLCQHCGRHMIGAAPSKLFCSARCRKAAYRTVKKGGKRAA